MKHNIPHQLFLMLLLHPCLNYIIQNKHLVCEWDIYDCIIPYNIHYTHRFICIHNNECPKNFKCCSHRCFRHNICQPNKDLTIPTKQISQHSKDHPGECNILLSCGIELPRSFTQRFECLQDDDCPGHFKCCYIQCYRHKVCQPAKNEYSLISTSATRTIKLSTPLEIVSTTPKGDVTDVPTELYSIYVTKEPAKDEEISTNIYKTSTWTTQEQMSNTQRPLIDEISSINTKETTTKYTRPHTEDDNIYNIYTKTSDEQESRVQTLAPNTDYTVTNDKEENTIDVDNYEDYVEGSGGIMELTTYTFLHTTQFSVESGATFQYKGKETTWKVGDDEDLIEASGDNIELTAYNIDWHTTQLTQSTTDTPEPVSISMKRTTDVESSTSSDDKDFVFEGSGSEAENFAPIGSFTTDEDLRVSNVTTVSNAYVNKNQMMESSTKRNFYDDEDIVESSGDGEGSVGNIENQNGDSGKPLGADVY